MPERILVVRMSAMGDLIQTTPVARGIKTAMPDCHLTWLAQTPFSSLLEHNPHIDELVTLPHRPGAHDLIATWWRLKAGEFTITVDPQGLLKSAVATWMSGAARRIGRAEAREAAVFAYNELSPERWDQKYVSQRYLEQCEPLGVSREDYVPEIFLADGDFGPADALWESEHLDEAGRVIVVAPFAAESWKEWPQRFFARLGDMLSESLDARVVIPGTESERERAEQVAARMRHRAIVFAGRTNMREAAALLSRADLVIGCDSGLVHMAFAVGAPVVCIIGPTPLRNGPKGELARTVYLEGVECRPCRNRHCSHRRCLEDLVPGMVFEAAQELAGAGCGR